MPLSNDRIKAFAIGLIAILAGHASAQGGGAAAVVTDTVARAEVAETVEVFGEIVATRESEVAVRISGAVTDVGVESGSQVAEGDVLAVIDRELLRLELRSAQAAMAEAEAGVLVAEADLTQARQSFARIEGLRGTNAFSQGAFEDRQSALARAEGALAEAEARRLAAEAARDRAQYDLDRARVIAPFAGTVLEVMIDPGEYVQTGTAVARLLDTRDVEVELSVPSRFVAALSPGMELSGQSDDGVALELVVRALLPTESTATRTRPVRLSAEFADRALPVAVGQSVTVGVPRSSPETLTLVPKDAVTQSRGSWVVFVNDDGTATPRDVDIGRSFGDRFEVLSGIAPGDEVVVRGNERLRPGQSIEARPAGGGEDAGAAGSPATGDAPQTQSQEDAANGATAEDRRRAAVAGR